MKDEGMLQAHLKRVLDRDFPTATKVIIGGPDNEDVVSISPFIIGTAGLGIVLVPDGGALVDQLADSSEEDALAAIKALPASAGHVILAFRSELDGISFILKHLQGALNLYASQFAETPELAVDYENEQVARAHADRLAMKRELRALIRALVNGDASATQDILHRLRPLTGHTAGSFTMNQLNMAARTAAALALQDADQELAHG